ncbi:hypothetical protein [Brevundimonas sp. TWP1-2-1b1]|uniref:hypothetical protein n=1 Tax=unclassified Brevundimonas TaxID=2622653 RepID=UPI003CE8DE05
MSPRFVCPATNQWVEGPPGTKPVVSGVVIYWMDTNATLKSRGRMADGWLSWVRRWLG